MKFTLKDYQTDAVAEVLDNMKKAKVFWRDHDMKTAFSLAATTGSGKTVMAAAVFEALLFGNDELEFEPDPGAVVIWFSDDPSLNEQSNWRLQEASDKLTISNLVTVESSFNREALEPGKIYFLNTQKLSKTSLLTRGDPDDAGLETVDGQKIMPDMRAFTIWDTIRNTIDDPDLTLYLVLDEAHRGMKDGKFISATGRPTIVKQLINGSGGTPGIPIVWGISATVQRFNDALRVRPETLCRITEFSEHESNGRELDEGERVAVEVLPVLGQSAAAVEPGDGAFDHPTPGLDDEALHPIGSLDDLGLEIGQDAGQGAVKDRPLIGAVGEQFPEKGKQTEQGRQQRETAVAILNVGGGDDAVQQQALRIDQNMPLLALDQLAGIEAVAVDASPPFSALFTL